MTSPRNFGEQVPESIMVMPHQAGVGHKIVFMTWLLKNSLPMFFSKKKCMFRLIC